MKQLWHYSQGYWQLGRLFLKQKRYATAVLQDLVHQSDIRDDGSLTSETLRRMRYYASMVPVVIGDTLHMLHGAPMPDDTRRGVTLYGLFTPLFDDWFDTNLPNATLARERVFFPERIAQDVDLQRLTFQNLRALLAHSAQHAPNWEGPAGAVIDAQINSLQQRDSRSTVAQIREVTWEKGGASVLGVRHFLPGNLSEAERDMCVQLGGMMQYLDDLFDVFADIRDGIRTIVTECRDFDRLQRDYDGEVRKLHKLLMSLPYPAKNKEQLWRLWCLMWVRGDIAVRHFQKLSAQKVAENGHYDPHVCTRRELVCDMERIGNILRSTHLYLTKY